MPALKIACRGRRIRPRGQPWRPQPEIAPERRRFLAERRAVTPNIIQRVYPFRDIALTREEAFSVTEEHREAAAIYLERASLRDTQLTGAILQGAALTPFDALAMSIQNPHGRVFAFQAGDPQRVVNTVEAMVGLFVESLIVAVITRRILGLR